MRKGIHILGLLVAVAAQDPCGCTDTEVCCQDTGGYECCIKRETFCVKANYPYSSRCCPRWTVGCNVGSVGCCDPARPWQREPGLQKEQPQSGLHMAPLAATNTSQVAFALYVTGLANKLSSYTFSLNGTILNRAEVTGPASDWFATIFGESTRIFSFDRKRRAFHFIDYDSTESLTLYTIDAASGSSKAVLIKQGSYPSGFAYHLESDKMFFSTLRDGSFVFYTTDVDTGATTRTTQHPRGSAEKEPSYYCGYITGVSQDGHNALRVGFQTYEKNMTGAGVGLTPVSGAGVPAWQVVPVSEETSFVWTFARKPYTDSYLSLAPTKTGSRSFAVVSWNTTAAAPVVLARFDNAHPPSVVGLGPLGYIASDYLDGTFASVVLHSSGREHQWALAVYEEVPRSTAVNLFHPEFIASSAASLSGFGLAAAP